jgi:multicomponent Na+:H+ antiporter subunit D
VRSATCGAEVDRLVPLLLSLPLLAAALVRVPAIWRRRGLATALACAAAATTAAIAVVLAVTGGSDPVVHWVGGWEPRDGVVIGIALVADGFSAGFVAAAAAATTAVLWHALGTYERTGGMFEVLTLLLLVASTGFVLSADLFSMFVFVELLGITVYAVTASKVDDQAAVPGAFNVAVTSTLGAVFLLLGVTLVYGAVGTPSLAEAGMRLATTDVTTAAVLGVALLVTGLAVKAGLVPFHFGHLDAETVARAPHAGLFGAVTVPAGLYGLARVQSTVVPGLGDPALLRPVLLTVATVTALVGGLLALAQTHLKRLLACSSVAHAGIAAVGIALVVPAGLGGSAVYLLGHGALKLGLFLAVGVVLHRCGSVETGRLLGRAHEARVAAVVLAVGGPLLAGLPPSGLAAGKAAISAAAEDLGFGWLTPLLYLAAALTGLALVRAAVHLWRGWPLAPDTVGRIGEGGRETLAVGARPPRAFTWMPAVLVAASVLVAVVPGLAGAAAVAASSFADPEVHAAALLGVNAPPGDVVPPLELWKPSAVGWGVAAGGVAMSGGVRLARRGRRPARGAGRRATFGAWSGRASRGFRLLHSGHVGDYTAWVTLGASACCAAVLLLHRIPAG